MATFSLEDLQKLFDSTSDAKLGAFITELKAAGSVMTDTTVIAERFGNSMVQKLEDISSKTKAATANFGQFSSAADNMRRDISGAINSIVDKFGDFIQSSDMAADGLGVLAVEAGLALEPLIGLIPDSIGGLGELGKAGYDAGSKITTAWSGVSPMLQKIGIPEQGMKMFEAMVKGADQAYSFQRGIVSLAAAQGTLNSMIDSSNGRFKDLNQAYIDQTNLAYQSAIATGQTVESMMDLSKAIGSIPGALTESIDAGDAMSQLVATSKLAAGFMVSQTDVAAKLSSMYTDMGIKGQDAFEALANIYEKAGDSKLRFETFSSTVMGIAQSFKMLGDNTRAATEVVRAFDSAFKNSDISPAAMKEVIEGITSGIQNMDRGRQAFVSGATGGPGGLAGAFQMEYAMQTGGMDEVLKKTMAAMQGQFGGQVLTLKDAAENPALAGEFYKQVQYLTQVAGVAKNDRDAYRILEAMQSGVTDMLTPGAGAEEGSKALESAVGRGNEIQEKQTSFLMRIHQNTEYLKYIRSDMMRAGSEGANEFLTPGLASRMRGAGIESASRGITAIAGKGGGLVSQDREASIRQFLDNVDEGPLGTIFNNMRGIGEKMVSGTSSPVGYGAGFAPGVEPAAGDVSEMFSPLKARGGGGPASTMSAIPIDVTHNPIELTINIPQFDQKMKAMVDQRIDAAQRGQVIGGATGNPKPQ